MADQHPHAIRITLCHLPNAQSRKVVLGGLPNFCLYAMPEPAGMGEASPAGNRVDGIDGRIGGL
jgi:hypothetical protein